MYIGINTEHKKEEFIKKWVFLWNANISQLTS